MDSLYGLTENYRQLLDIADQLDSEVFDDTLQAIDDSIEDKVENTVKLIKSLEANSVAFDTQIREFQERKKATNNKVVRLKEYLKDELLKIDKRSVKGDLFSVAIQKNNVSLSIEDETYIPEGFYVEQEPKLDKKQLLKEIKEGLEVPGVELKQSESIRIR